MISISRRIIVLLTLHPLLFLAVALASPPEDGLRMALAGQAPAISKAEALVTLATRSITTDPAGSLGHARNALLYAERSGDTRAEHMALHAKGEAELNLGLYAEALRTWFQALEVARATGDVRAIANDLMGISDAYRFNQNMDKAVEEARNALAMLLATHDEEAIDKAHGTLMRCLMEAGRYDEAITLGTTALKRLESQPDTPAKARLWQHIAQVLLAQAKYNDALPLLVKAERVLEVHGDVHDGFMLDIDMARAHIGIGLHEIATERLRQAEGSLPAAPAWRNTDLLLDTRYQLALGQERWQEALGLLQEKMAREDSLAQGQVRLKMAGMQVLHDLDLRDEDNARLLVRNVMHEETIADQRAQNRWLVAMSAGLLTLTIVLFITVRHALRMNRRLKMKTAVIGRQSEVISAKNMELQRQNLRLSESLVNEEEQEMLIKEIHHRVKNNLQVVDSLLSIQGSQHMDPVLEKQFREAQGRIRSMALVHEHIYRSGSAKGASLKTHLEQLARSVLVAYGMHDRISVSVTSPLDGFPEDIQMPLTLVVNELLTNAVKHAFTGREQGHVRIVVRPAAEGYELLFSDDGHGLGVEGGYLPDSSFGMELVGILARQLNGEVRLLKGLGTTFSLTFAPDRKAMRAAS